MARAITTVAGGVQRLFATFSNGFAWGSKIGELMG